MLKIVYFNSFYEIDFKYYKNKSLKIGTDPRLGYRKTPFLPEISKNDKPFPPIVPNTQLNPVLSGKD
jgi:hypothetical protein